MVSELDYMRFIQHHISEAALYEQLAEECVELAHIALKKARKLREENPTPISMQDIDDNLTEEFSDIVLVSDILCIKESSMIKLYKLQRWAHRNGFTED